MRRRCELTANRSIWEHIEHMLGHWHMPKTHCFFQNWNWKDTRVALGSATRWPVQWCQSLARGSQAGPGDLAAQSPGQGACHCSAGMLRGRTNPCSTAHIHMEAAKLWDTTLDIQQHGFGMWSSINVHCHCCIDSSEPGWVPKEFWRALVPQDCLLI